MMKWPNDQYEIVEEREKFIIKAALLYAQVHLASLNWELENHDPETIFVNGDVDRKLTDEEIADLVTALQ